MTEYVTASYDVNGERMTVAHPPHHTLLEVLREGCDLTGTKHGCELGECGACAVLVDGEPQLSWLVLARVNLCSWCAVLLAHPCFEI